MPISNRKKLDVNHLKRKQAGNPAPSLSRQLLSAESRLFKPAVKKVFRYNSSQAVKTLRFGLTCIALVLAVQGLLYLSSARNAAGEILGVAESAYSQLDSASKNLTAQELSQAQDLFSQAFANIKSAQDMLSDYKVLTWVTPQANTAGHVLAGSGFLAEAGSKLTEAFDYLNDLTIIESGSSEVNLYQRIRTSRRLLADSQALLVKSMNEFDQAGSIPADYAQKFSEAKTQLQQLNTIMEHILAVQNLYLTMFEGEKTYLLIFQNYDEARATGGFIGTFGRLRISNGNIQDLKIESIYNLDGQLTTDIAAPGPFQPDIQKWGIRDANWFVDFPTSAGKILYFYEKTRETADGVIAMTPKTFAELLRLTGPIEMPEYDAILTAENFQDVVQFETSVDYDKELNQPKKFLNDFAPILLSKISSFNKEQWMDVVSILWTNLNNRHIMMYSTNQSVQAQIEARGFSGRVLSTDHDYIMINNSNLGGTKTDLDIQQKVQLESKLLSDGSIKNTLHIARSNTSSETNRNYLRVLVPKGSQLISATGFAPYNYYASSVDGMRTDADLAAWDQGKIQSEVLVHEEAGKTEFSGWSITAGLENTAVSLTYVLPFRIDQSYSLLLQKQPGSLPYEFTGRMEINDARLVWTNEETVKNGSNVIFQSQSDTDDFWALVVEK